MMNSNLHIEKASELRNLGQFVEAERVLDDFLALEPDHLGGLQLAGALKAGMGNLPDAIELLNRAISIAPQDPDPLVNLATALNAIGQPQECLNRLDAALRLDQGHRLANLNRIYTLTSLGRWDEAARAAAALIALDPTVPEAHMAMAEVQNGRSRPDVALPSLNAAVRLNPANPESHLRRAQTLASMGRPDQALPDLAEVIDLAPSHYDAHFLRAVIFAEAGLHEAALVDLDAAAASAPDVKSCLLQKGHCLLALGREPDALEAFEAVSALDPSHIHAAFNAGTVALGLRRYDHALTQLGKVIAAEPGHIAARVNRSTALRALQRYEEALEDASHVFRLDPENADTNFNCGVLYGDLRDYARAIFYYTRVIELDPKYVKALVARAMIFHEIGRYPKMLEDLDLALEIDPENEGALFLRFNGRPYIKDLDGTVSDYKKIVARGLSQKYMQGDYLHAKMQMCDWEGLPEIYAGILSGIENNEPCATPFCIIPYSNSAQALRQCGTIYSSTECGPKNDIEPILPYPAKDKIRIGYFSADYYDHATMHLMAGMFEHHDRSKFETYAISYGPQSNDTVRKRAEAAFDHFIDASEMNEKTMALVARHFEIDIAIDLKGYTAHSRPNIFAYRAAPVQVNYLGYPGSMGADFIDYIIADRVVIPEHLAALYSEKVLYLPNSYQANDSTRKGPDLPATRQQHGLPENAFVFCSFNNNYKIVPEVFSIWCDLLNEVEGSVLWLLADNAHAVRNLRRHATSHGIDPDRLIFAERVVAREHLARHKLADLFLDTFPCNAHTTASDALLMGLPMLTITGETFASRVAASLLTAAGLPELVCSNLEEYRSKALSLARNHEERNKIASSLVNGIQQTPLYDTAAFTKSFEALLEQIVRRP